jgi:hypothetical protein
LAVVSYHGVFGGLELLLLNVGNLDIFARHRVSDDADILALALGIHVVPGFTTLVVVLKFGFDLGVAVLLFPVQAFHKLLDVGNTILTRVVLPRRVHVLYARHSVSETVVWSRGHLVMSFPCALRFGK